LTGPGVPTSEPPHRRSCGPTTSATGR
jgi:hypothetical protein